jgi:hypothetical protein
MEVDKDMTDGLQKQQLVWFGHTNRKDDAYFLLLKIVDNSKKYKHCCWEKSCFVQDQVFEEV